MFTVKQTEQTAGGGYYCFLRQVHQLSKLNIRKLPIKYNRHKVAM